MAGMSLFQVGEDVEFWRVLVQLSILAFCLVLVESAVHQLEHAFPPSEKYQHMLKKAYRELMVLGLISLGLKILKETPAVDSYSKTMLAFQVADLTIFLLALALILQSTAVFLLLRNQNDRAECAELIKTQDLVDVVTKADDPTNVITFMFQSLFYWFGTAKEMAKTRELIELRLLRRLLLHRFGLPQLFPYSKYLNRAQASQIAHMIEVEPAMWIVVLVMAWSICGMLELFRSIDTNMPVRHELVGVCVMFSWVLLLLHVLVYLYFRSCIHHLLHAAAFSYNKTTLVANLSVIAHEEAEAWEQEEADKALEIMGRIQEHHEELELQRLRTEKRGGIQRRSSYTGVVQDSTSLDIRYFSQRGWHLAVMILLIMNGFFITLFIQCAVYDLNDIYHDFGTLATIMVPLPLLINSIILQRHIFYDFVVVSNTLRIDSHTLSDVIENFREVVRLRSEFATAIADQMVQHELAISDLATDLKARDPNGTGFIDVDDLRDVLSKFGYRLTRFRFNSVVKLLFQLEGTTVPYSHVIRLVLMAHTENFGSTLRSTQAQSRAIFQQSQILYSDVGQPTMDCSQSSYAFFDSTREASVMAPTIEPSGFVQIAMGSRILPQSLRCGVDGNIQQTSLRSQTMHDLFNLQRLSDQPGMMQL